MFGLVLLIFYNTNWRKNSHYCEQKVASHSPVTLKYFSIKNKKSTVLLNEYIEKKITDGLCIVLTLTFSLSWRWNR